MKFPQLDLSMPASVVVPGEQFARRDFTNICLSLCVVRFNALNRCERILTTAGESKALVFVRSQMERMKELHDRLENRSILNSGFVRGLDLSEVAGRR